MKIVFIVLGLNCMFSAYAVLPANLQTKVTDIKKKGCPIVNGKEDCTIQEVKDKAIEVKSKYIKK